MRISSISGTIVPILLILGSLLFSCQNESKDKKQEPVAAVTAATALASGRQPQVAVGKDGVARVVFGDGNKIYYAVSEDNGRTFTEPELIDSVAGLYLGMSMGPQIASSENFSLVTAIDKKGNIHSYSLQHETGVWSKAAAVNDVPGVAPEGMMAVEADGQDNFYAVWLDVRNDNKNKIALATTSGPAAAWSQNKIIYTSPDKTVCECCKPGIEVQDDQVVLMFRNWLDGSRDFYIARSEDGGRNFPEPQKLGKGTWKLEGCPMDGGDILLDSTGTMHTVWQRNGHIFYAKPGEEEQRVGEGRNARLTGSTAPVITWNNAKTLKLQQLAGTTPVTVGEGSYLEAAELPDKSILLIWENEDTVFFRKYMLAD